MKIAFLGPEGSYSHLAAKEFLKMENTVKKSARDWDECIPFRNFPEVLSAVEDGRVYAAAIPIENSIFVPASSPCIRAHFFRSSKAREHSCSIIGKN